MLFCVGVACLPFIGICEYRNIFFYDSLLFLQVLPYQIKSWSYLTLDLSHWLGHLHVASLCSKVSSQYDCHVTRVSITVERSRSPLFLSFFVYLFFWVRARESWGRAERGRDREPQVGSTQSVQSPMHAQTHELWDHDLSQSQLLNPLSHPGAHKIALLTEPLESLSFPSVTFSVRNWSIRPTHIQGEGDWIPPLSGGDVKEFAAMFWNHHRWILSMVYSWDLK